MRFAGQTIGSRNLWMLSFATYIHMYLFVSHASSYFGMNIQLSTMYFTNYQYGIEKVISQRKYFICL
jgi:hypothetical protein